MTRSRIYLDHAATSPLRPEAKAAMEEGFAIWANPSSPHAEGRKAKQALEGARARVKAALAWDGEVIFTSGASEALWIALNRAKVDRRIISAVEHDAVFRAAPDAEVISVDGEGRVDLSTIDSFERSIVAIQHVNSETGTRQPIVSYLPEIKATDGLLLCDCSQSAGKFALPACDMAVVSAHKLGGPIGIGALLVRDYAMLEPMGGHERGYRQGTENMPAALGFAAALEAWEDQSCTEIEEAFDQVHDDIFASGGHIVDLGAVTSSFLHAFAHPTMSAQAQLIRLDAMGFAVSAGSACSSGTLKKSRVLDAFGVPDDVAARTIRVSMGWSTKPEELEAFAEAWRSLS
ncbi:aminotransferase class V-fold PLP-dependent enzyme [Citromicrobium bathyomarinum]|nr:aminotransferase class V-fold PLP-dependent enzyme [Citromicrobium bathyomarinum]MCD1623827.1 aminotransferase class V-fold PLP-dependent enzyme [Citromicrobium bathyomarinum]